MSRPDSEDVDEAQISMACSFHAHGECEGGEPDEVGDYGTRYGWHDCSCKCHKKSVIVTG